MHINVKYWKCDAKIRQKVNDSVHQCRQVLCINENTIYGKECCLSLLKTWLGVYKAQQCEEKDTCNVPL